MHVCMCVLVVYVCVCGMELMSSSLHSKHITSSYLNVQTLEQTFCAGKEKKESQPLGGKQCLQPAWAT